MNNTEKNGTKVRSANIHVVGRCNYNCEHCFDRCLRSFGSMTPEEWKPILSYLKGIGIEKINIAGGEPMLYRHLDELCVMIKAMGFTVSIVSNGSLITEEWIKKMTGTVSWIGLSIDSCSEEDEILIGRHCTGVKHLKNIENVSKIARKYGMKVKLNITVVRKSCEKDFRPFIEKINADRVKVFRALTLEDANDDIEDVWSVTDEQFAAFKEKHKDCRNIVFEDNDDMVSSYLMFDPRGKWMVDKNLKKEFLEFDQFVRDGLESMVDVGRYYGRNAVYDWVTE